VGLPGWATRLVEREGWTHGFGQRNDGVYYCMFLSNHMLRIMYRKVQKKRDVQVIKNTKRVRMKPLSTELD
jgi:hypothetical protein